MRTHADYRNEILPNGLFGLFSQRRPTYIQLSNRRELFATERSDDVAFLMVPQNQEVLVLPLSFLFFFLIQFANPKSIKHINNIRI